MASKDSLRVGRASIELAQGDITHEDTDAIVNAANSGLMGGGGVDGAIHRAGGPQILAACKKIRERLPDGLPAGESVMTTAGDLKAQYVIHTVGPRWRGGNRDEALLLAGCYTHSLELAEGKALRSITFPSVSTGIYGYPVRKAAPVALSSVRAFLDKAMHIALVRFVLFDSVTYAAYRNALLSSPEA